MKILLIYPPMTVFGEDVTVPQVRPPLGLLYIAAVCERAGHTVEVLDCMAQNTCRAEAVSDGGKRFGLNPSELQRELETRKPDIIGISNMFTAFSRDAHEAASACKRWSPDVKVIMGGIHASTLPDNVLEDANIDYIVLGEGEQTILELLEALKSGVDPGQVAGLVFKGKDGVLTRTKPRERILDLDALPMPARHLVDLKLYSAVAENEADNYIMRHPYTTVYTSRGCPKRCVYCAAHNVWHNRWVARSSANVLDEVEYLVKEHGIREIHFLDDNISVDRKRFAEICQGILDRKLNIRWACPTGLAIWTLDAEVLALMKKAGCYKVCFGMESGHPDTQQFIRKGLDLEKADDAIKIASSLGFWIQSTFIIGFPYETREQIQTTIRYAIGTYSDFVNFLLLTPYPGTDVYEIMRKEELIPVTLWNYKNFGVTMSGFRTLCRSRDCTAEELSLYFDDAFKQLLRSRIARTLVDPLILLRKLRDLESLLFFMRMLKNFFGVAWVIFYMGVTKAGTLKPGYGAAFTKKD
ncbi:MAG: cobalamin-dependent protein [Candidatus Omnitrophota bacterium]